MADELDALNECLALHNVTVYKGSDGQFRMYGDINRIQDIVDGPCGRLLSQAARRDLDRFFAKEVDPRVAECLVRHGVDAVIDPSTGVGIEIRGDGPVGGELVEQCFLEAYEWFRRPPPERSAH